MKSKTRRPARRRHPSPLRSLLVEPNAAPMPPLPSQPIGPNVFYKKPPLKLRFYGWLGFSNRRAPQPTTAAFTEGFSNEWFTVATVAMFTWRERFLVLISGRVLCHLAIKMDKMIKKSNHTCAVSVLPPGYLPNFNQPNAAADIRAKIL